MAGDRNDMVVPSRAAWERVSRGVREAEAHRGRRGFGEEEFQGTMPGIIVEVTGLPVLVTTTTTTPSPGFNDPFRPTTSSTTTTTTTTTCYGNSTTTTPSGQVYIYPGRFLYRNIDTLTNEELYFPGENCWINEVQQQPLGIGCRFPGQMGGQYMGLPVINVRGVGNSLSCTLTTTSTTCACLGVCTWELKGTAPNQFWALIEDCNGQEVNTSTTSTSSTTTVPGPTTTVTTTTTSTTSGTGTTTPLPCGCPHPNWCPNPAISGCPNPTTFTYCERGVNYPPPWDVYFCVPSSTTSTTTTTADPMVCGSGCIYKYYISSGWVLLFNNCQVGAGCLGCPIPPSTGTPCTTASFPCSVPAPQVACGGCCRWIWEDLPLPGRWRQYNTNTTDCQCRCTTGNVCNGCSPGCVFSGPAQPGSTCGETTRTYCSCRGCPPGGSTTLTTTTTTSPGSCIGNCIVRWSEGLQDWIVVTRCGASCDCEIPLVPGINSCDIAETACFPTTTSQTTTTTTSTTTTTTLTTCPPVGFEPCTFRCENTDDGYLWVLCRDRCDHGQECFCCSAYINPPGSNCGLFNPICPDCNVLNEGNYCGRSCNCGTTSTTTTTTTTTSGSCENCSANCCWLCADVGTSPLGVTQYEWLLCNNLCGSGTGGGSECMCPSPFSVCGVCTSGQAGDICESDCDCGTPAFTGAFFDNPKNSGYAGSMF